MRRYLQGTLDFACGIYAVINALSCMYGLDLAGARKIFQETLLQFAAAPSVWPSFVCNNTDHYWVIRYMLERWCDKWPYEVEREQPFSNCMAPDPAALDCNSASLYLPEQDEPEGPAMLKETYEQAVRVWDALDSWFAVPGGKRSAILRFHRFIPGISQPVVSHWTTVLGVERSAIRLHDASGENKALHELEKDALITGKNMRPFLRIVPESIALLQRRY